MKQQGNSFIDTLAKEIRPDSPKVKDFSARNLRYMKKFAKEITDQNFLQTVSAKFSKNCDPKKLPHNGG